MLQIYSFHGTEYHAVYAQSNEFLRQISEVPYAEVKPESIRSNTKTYMDYQSSITTIDIVVDFGGTKSVQSENAQLIQKIHDAILAGPEQPPEAEKTGMLVDHDPFDPFLDSDEALP